MEWIATIPIWVLAPLIFLLRIADVTMGTLRTLAVVQGRVRISLVLGFFEVLIWVMVISQVIQRVHESFLLVVAYAGGFAAGNAAGILVDRAIGMGSVVLRMVSAGQGGPIAKAVRERGFACTTFQGEGRDGPVTMIIIMCERRDLPQILDLSRGIDPDIFYIVEGARESGRRLGPLPDPTGWRAVFKKK